MRKLRPRDGRVLPVALTLGVVENVLRYSPLAPDPMLRGKVLSAAPLTLLWVENLSISWCRCHRRLLDPQCPAILKLTWAGNERLANSHFQALRPPWNQGLASLTTAFWATGSHSSSREREFPPLPGACSMEGPIKSLLDSMVCSEPKAGSLCANVREILKTYRHWAETFSLLLIKEQEKH